MTSPPRRAGETPLITFSVLFSGPHLGLASIYIIALSGIPLSPIFDDVQSEPVRSEFLTWRLVVSLASLWSPTGSPFGPVTLYQRVLG
jgi:hypothetical protein